MFVSQLLAEKLRQKNNPAIRESMARIGKSLFWNSNQSKSHLERNCMPLMLGLSNTYSPNNFVRKTFQRKHISSNQKDSTILLYSRNLFCNHCLHSNWKPFYFRSDFLLSISIPVLFWQNKVQKRTEFQKQIYK